MASVSYDDVELSDTLEKTSVQEPVVNHPTRRVVFIWAALTVIIVMGVWVTSNSDLVSLGIMIDGGWLSLW